MLNKKIWASFQRIIELFTQNIVTKLSKIWVWIRDPKKTYSASRIPDPGVKKALDSGSGSATLVSIKLLRWNWWGNKLFFVKVLWGGFNLFSVGFQRHSYHRTYCKIVHCKVLCCWSDGVLLEVWTRAHRSQAGLQVQPARHGKVSTREMENISIEVLLSGILSLSSQRGRCRTTGLQYYRV